MENGNASTTHGRGQVSAEAKKKDVVYDPFIKKACLECR
jgi:hypothetical protein